MVTEVHRPLTGFHNQTDNVASFTRTLLRLQQEAETGNQDSEEMNSTELLEHGDRHPFFSSSKKSHLTCSTPRYHPGQRSRMRYSRGLILSILA